MGTKKNILLGTISIIHSNWLPYAVGCLISHCKSIDQVNQRYHFHEPIYKHKPVTEYHTVLANTDILGLTCYVWNQSYNDELAAYYKSINPAGIVVYGGPQVPENQLAKISYDDKRSWLDTSIAGLGEIAFSEWLLDLPFSNSTLTTMPTPYTDGVFDSILATGEKFKVSFETNRGCPYSCAFCDWGGQSRSKLTKFNVDDVYSTIAKIYDYKNIVELEILDANFGILKQDIDIVQAMIDNQNLKDNYLRISYSGIAKNGSKNLPVILEKIFDNIPIDQRNLKISFQTHTPEVLANINRSNIDNSRLAPLILEYKNKNIPTTSEMIIALPGETALSWLRTLDYNFHTLGIDYVRTYFLHLVANIDMATPEYQQQHGIQTKTIAIGHQQFEIIHRCNSYNQDELVRMFDYHWFYHTLVNTNLIKNNINNIYKDTLRFFAQLDDMPVLNSLVERNRSLVRNIFSDEPVTTLTNKHHQRFFSASMRTDDIVVILENQIAVAEELSAFVQQPLEVEWLSDNPLSADATIT